MSEFLSDVSARKWGEEVLGSEVPVLVGLGADWCESAKLSKLCRSASDKEDEVVENRERVAQEDCA